MAYKALDMDTHEIKDVEWFIKNRKTGFCEVCGNLMEPKAINTPGTRTHLTHLKNTGCPTVDKNGKKFQALSARNQNANQGEVFKLEVKENLFSIYLTCSRLVGKLLTKADYRDLLNKANEKKVWDYVGISLKYVPYILVSIHEGYFVDPYKKEKFFFALTPELSFFDDLWNDKRMKQFVWKISSDGDVLQTLRIEDELDQELSWFEHLRDELNF